MEKIKNTLLGDIHKSYPKIINPSLINSYLTTPRIPPKLVKVGKVKHIKPTLNKDGSVYTGQANEKGMFLGVGVLVNPSENIIYEGCFKDNIFKGFGRLFKSDSIIEGVWRGNSLKNDGKIYNLKQGTVYEGEIVERAANGNGKMIKKGQWTYIGEFKNGYKHGQGQMVWDTLEKYEGAFANDKQEGIGKFFWRDGIVYEGEWLKSKMHGSGVYECPQYKYEGQFINGMKQGHGVCVWTTGKRYEGFWMKDRYDGIGTETNEKGEENTCIWRNGSIINSHSDEILNITSGMNSSRASDVRVPNKFVNKEDNQIIHKQIQVVKANMKRQNEEKLSEKASDNPSLKKSEKSVEVFAIKSEVNSQKDFSQRSRDLSKKLDFEPILGDISPREDEKEIRNQEAELNFSKDFDDPEHYENRNQKNEFQVELSVISDGSSPEPLVAGENDMGEVLKDFVLSGSSKSQSLQTSKAESSIQYNMPVLLTPAESVSESISSGESKQSEAILIKSNVSESKQSSRRSDKSHNEDPSEQESKIKKPPKVVKVPKLLIVDPEDVRLKIHNDPMFQISYKTFKKLPVFEYLRLEDKHSDLVLTSDWIQLPKGRVYKGEMGIQGEMCGNGVILKKGTIYQGNVFRNKKHGIGRFITALGRVYEGHYVRGKREGFGVFTSENELYCGDWRLESYHGLGVLQNKHGTYDGAFIYGICEGYGKLLYKDGNEYIGEFKNGVPHGYGDLVIESVIESGHWKCGVQAKLELAATKKVTRLTSDGSQGDSDEEENDSSEDSDNASIPAEIDD